MRRAFVDTLISIAEEDSRTCLLTGDLGYMVLEPFAERFPERFFNVGVAEQNMVGLATGMAEAGFVPYVYSIATFAVLRPYEFIRNGPLVHQLRVRLVGVGGGMEYGTNGISHYSLDDVGVMRVQPGMTVIVPADSDQTRTAVRAVHGLAGPIYLRLGKDDRKVVPELDGRFRLGKCERLLGGDRAVVVAMGAIATEAVEAVTILQDRGVPCSVAIVSTLAPPPVNDLVELLQTFSVAVTVEAHYRIGGLGSLLSEVVAENGLACRVLRCAVGSVPATVSGSQRAMERAYGLDVESLVATVQAVASASADAAISP